MNTTAAQEIDIQIAEKLFGMTVSLEEDECHSSFPGAKWEPGIECWMISGLFMRKEEEDYPEYLPAYSTSIHMAFEALEYLVDSKGGIFTIQSTKKGRREYFCTIALLPSKDANYYVRYTANASTLPMAICLAILKNFENLKLTTIILRN